MTEFIGDIKSDLTQIEHKLNQQTTIIDEMTNQNSSIIHNLAILNANIDNLINKQSTTPDNNNFKQLEPSFGTFNMESKTINFNGKIYKYTKEQLCSDKKSLLTCYNNINNNTKNAIFPQGKPYIFSLFETKIQLEETVIILSNQINDQATLFCFPLIQYKDLCYSKGYRVVNRIKELKKLKDYSTDNYPQGRDYCIKLINENLNEDECFHIIARKDGEKWTRYYFKSKYININPSKVRFLCEKSQLESELNHIMKSNKKIFPQGIAYCMEIIQNQIKTNGEVFIVNENEMISYFQPEKVKYFCNCEWRGNNYELEFSNVEKRSVSQYDNISQGRDYCIKLLDDLKERNGIYRVFIKNTNKMTFFFYFNDDYD